MNSSDLLTRLALTFTFVSSGLALYFLYNWMLSRRVSLNLFTDLGIRRPGGFLIVYFSSPTCTPCKTIQRPALEAVLALMGGGLQVLEIDASRQPEIANRWGVLSAPTTYVIDPQGRIKHINHGVAHAKKLLIQLHADK